MANQAHESTAMENSVLRIFTNNRIWRYFANHVARIQVFYQEVKVEMIKVTWPTQDDLRSSTTVVMMLLVIMAVLVGVFDIIFQKVVMKLLELS